MEESSQRLERLQDLEQVEAKIVEMLHSGGLTLQELGKDKPVVKNVEREGGNFIKCLKSIDEILSQQMTHLSQISTGANHEGTHYDSAKDREISTRCLHDIEDMLQSLVEAKQSYLAEMATEGTIVLDGEATDAAT